MLNLRKLTVGLPITIIKYKQKLMDQIHLLSPAFIFSEGLTRYYIRSLII